MTASTRRITASCMAFAIGLACAGCARSALQAGNGDAQAELEAALAAERNKTRPAPPVLDERPGPEIGSEVAENLARGHREAEAGRPDQAARFYERVLREDPRHPVAHHRLAVIADQNRDFPAAERHYGEALAARPGDPDVLNDFGYSYLMQGRYAESERTLRDALATAPTHERALTNLGMLYATVGDTDRALAVLRLTGSEDEARAKLALLAPAPQRHLAARPPGAPAAGEAIRQAAAFESGYEDLGQGAPTQGPTAQSPAMQDLMGQLARAKQEASQLGGDRRPAPARLPGLIDPTAQETAGGAYGSGPAQPYSRSRPDTRYAALPPQHAAAAGYGPVGNRPASLPAPGDLPLWSPGPATPAGPQPGPRPPITPVGYETASAGGLPPAAFAPTGPPAANGLPPSRFDSAAGHSAPGDYADPRMQTYADDLASRDAEIARMRQLLQTQPASAEPGPVGEPPAYPR